MNDEIGLEEQKEYFSGTANRLVRYWYYLENGLNILNEFRNLFLGIIALYIALHLENMAYLVLMLIPSLIILTIVGYYYVHRFAKVKEWVNLRFSTHFAIRNFDYQKGTYELLKEIKDALKDGKKD